MCPSTETELENLAGQLKASALTSDTVPLVEMVKMMVWFYPLDAVANLQAYNPPSGPC